MRRIAIREFMSVRSGAEGVATLSADSYALCPWCKDVWVYLCRRKPQAQWIPVESKEDVNGIHDPHRCPQAKARNHELKVFLGLEEPLEKNDDDTEKAIVLP